MANNLREWKTHLPYWKLLNKKEKVVIVSQTGSISSPIHNQRGWYFYNMTYYEILKEPLQVLHKLQPKYFQIATKKYFGWSLWSTCKGYFKIS